MHEHVVGKFCDASSLSTHKHLQPPTLVSRQVRDWTRNQVQLIDMFLYVLVMFLTPLISSPGIVFRSSPLLELPARLSLV